MSEEIIGRINGLRRLDNKYFNLVFTDNRLIGEYVAGTGIFLALGTLGLAAAEPGIRNQAAQMGINKTPEKILSEHKINFEINNFDIDKIIVKKSLFDSSMLIKFNQKVPKLGKNVLFLFPKKGIEEVEPVVIHAFPNKVTVKK